MALRDELLNDPNGLGYAPFIASGNDGAIFDLLNAKTISVNGFVPENSFSIWAAQTHQAKVIVDQMNDTTDTLGQRSTAIVLNKLMVGGPPLDLSHSAIIAMLDSWFDAGLGGANGGQIKDALIALSQKLISRADQLGVDCSMQAISQALGS